MVAPFTKVQGTQRGGEFHLVLRGELDFDDAEDIQAAWDAAEAAGAAVTVVDLSQVSFADSMLLNELLHAHEHHQGAGRSLVLQGPLKPAVSRLLSLSGTREHFTITDHTP
ncbi:STAS domain-containing protein [Streptomyces galbus]|uniref:STAS domain-containing protein n=1 Tax=Streptomyces galbus TaxID=33898 RepID=A0A4U5WVT2_STRGB|nr:STAS domain-containing protein [Streptomyces galbus]TKT06628.1 STAS domain-containing protein [Streptomyces galbus]GHD53624.1 hypothetical protein GCM10010335_67330 [Streptomyces galbus]